MLALEETLSGYLPDVVLRRLARASSFPTAPALERFPAAVLFADISGFTRLTEHFAQQGACGAEQVSAHLNAYFEQLIDSIAGHGGDVVKFAGDALVSVFSAEALGEPLAVCARRATQCGLAIQDRLRDYELEGVRLKLRIGVGVG